MDNFINLAKKGYQAYEESQQSSSNSNSNNYNSNSNSNYNQEQSYAPSQQQSYGQQGQDQSYGSDNYGQPQSGGGHIQAHVNEDQAIQSARRQSNNNDDDDRDDSLYSNALSFAKQQYGTSDKASEPIDEDQAQQVHAQAYHQGQASNLDTNSMGMAAAMQAMKMFTGGSGSASSSGGAQGSSQMIGMAMSEANKLFSQTGGAADGGSKQDVMNVAAGMIMKLVVQSKMSGLMGGSSGLLDPDADLGILPNLGMASQFLK